MNLILGTANFCNDYGKRIDKDGCFRILDRANELGIRTVATAFDYGYQVVSEYGWKDILHKYKPGLITWNGVDGVSIDEYKYVEEGLIMAPFNPIDLRFYAYASDNRFIARSIFCGGKLQRSNKEDIARLVFGFLKSHFVKNSVFGVESVEELELIVRVANEK